MAQIVPFFKIISSLFNTLGTVLAIYLFCFVFFSIFFLLSNLKKIFLNLFVEDTKH